MVDNDRQVVQVGVDLRPLPLGVGPDVWMFDPDPAKEFFVRLSVLSKKMQAGADDDESRWDAIDGMRDLLADALIGGSDDRAAFIAKGYGMTALGGIAKAYAEQVAGVPTKSASPSGAGQQRRGGSR